jgi:hypothetical protein
MEEVERLMAETYSQKERRVLEAIRDQAGNGSLLIFEDLEKRLGMPDDLVDICIGLHEKGWINFPGGEFR